MSPDARDVAGAANDEASFASQRALAAHIRDPDSVAPPAGIDARRLQVYRELFFNNVESILAGNFPVIRRVLGETAWTALVRDFYRDHPSRTPLFPELAREFLQYVQARDVARGAVERGDAAWRAELAHYEWVELALQISESRVEDVPHDASGDLLDSAPALSPLAWPLAYQWPVHRLGPDYLPAAPPDTPTLLLVQRDAAGSVRFSELTPMTFRLLQRLEACPDATGRSHLRALALEAGATDTDALIEPGLAMLESFRASGVVLGTHR